MSSRYDLDRIAKLGRDARAHASARPARPARPVVRPWRRAVATLGLLALLGACGSPAATVAPTAAPTQVASAPTVAPSPPPPPPPPTATTAPTVAPSTAPTVAAVPPSPTAVPSPVAPPTPAAASPTPAATGDVLVDPDRRCQFAVPAGFRLVPDQAGTLVSDEGLTIIGLGSYDGGTLRVRDSATTFVETLQADTPGYEETYRSGGPLVSGGEEEIINFDLTIDEQALRGQFYFRRFAAPTVCVLTYVRPAPGDAQLVNVPDWLIDSLALLQP